MSRILSLRSLILGFVLPSAWAGLWVSVNTTTDHAYYHLNDLGVRVKDETLVFDVTSSQDAILRLAHVHDLSGSTCDIIIGSGSNTALSVRESCSSCYSTQVASGVFLNATSPRSFWFDWRESATLQGGTGRVVGQSVLFTYTWTERFEVNYLAATSWHGHSGHWRFLIDTPPQFILPNSDGSTVIQVPENEPIGSSLMTLDAQDDEGDSVTFAVIGPNAGSFECQGSDVILREKLDFETDKLLVVMVIASDENNNSSVTFTLRITDVIDEPPMLTRGSVTSLREETAIGTVIGGIFLVTDKDEKDTLSFSLSGINSNYFAINDSTGVVTVANRIDREGLGGLSYLDDVSVVVTDSAGLVTWLNLTLDIVDVNDNPPAFGSAVYNVNITNTSTTDTHLLTIDVSDADVGSNGDVMLTVLEDQIPKGVRVWTVGTDLHLNISTVDLTSGPVSFTLTLLASDCSTESPNLTAFAVVRVQVQPSNDHVPTWIGPVPDASGRFPDLTIPEDTPLGTTVITLTGSDSDPGYYGHVVYSIKSAITDTGSDAITLFTMNETSGALRTVGALDRDPNTGGTTYYLLTVTASDLGAQSTEAVLRITLTDVNDNPPTFSQLIYTKDIPCDAAVGSTLISLTSGDNDLTFIPAYEIHTGDRTLDVNDVTGDVMLKNSAAGVTSGVHTLVVTVRDGGVPEMTSTAALVLQFETCVSSTSSLSSSSTSQTPTASPRSGSDDDRARRERILHVTCGVLGAGLLLSITMHVISKCSHKSHIQPLNSQSSSYRTSEAADHKGNETSSSVSSRKSSRDSGAVTELTDCSSLQSLSLV